MIREVLAGIEIAVLVVPRSAKTRVIGLHDERIKIAVAAPPVDGAANHALIKALSRWLGLAKGRISIVRGSEGRRKTINLAGTDRGEVEKWLSGAPKG
jgi:uncharacterized protein (TIGR00251 family)